MEDSKTKRDLKMKFSIYFERFKKKFDSENRTHVLWACDDPGLERLLDMTGSNGCAEMDEDSNIYIQLRDPSSVGRGVCLEELGHAIQFLQEGNVELSCDHRQRAEREVEINQCLLDRNNRDKKKATLTESELDVCRRQVEYYKGFL